MIRPAPFICSVALSVAAATPAAFAQTPHDSVATHVRRLHTGDAVDRSKAAKALGALGESGKAAVPALVQAMGDRDPFVARDAVAALCNMPAAVPHLVEALDSPNKAIRHYAAVALSRIGPTDRTAVKAIVQALQSPEPQVR